MSSSSADEDEEREWELGFASCCGGGDDSDGGDARSDGGGGGGGGGGGSSGDLDGSSRLPEARFLGLLSQQLDLYLGAQCEWESLWGEAEEE